METHIEALKGELIEAGFKAAIWQGRRVYLNGYGRDVKAWIEPEVPDAPAPNDIYAGCSLKVFSNCDQSHKWLVNRAKQMKHLIMQQLADSGIVKDEICQSWQDVTF